MTRSLHNEWRKTGTALLLLYILGLGVPLYCLLAIQGIVDHGGAETLWLHLSAGGSLPLKWLRYQPLLSGIVLALVRFLPEVLSKHSKDPLYESLGQRGSAYTTLSFGAAALVLLFLLQVTFAYLFLRHILTPELITQVLVTAAPWLMAGISGYGLTAMVVLEPGWRMRLADLALAAAILHLYFVTSAPGAYEELLWLLLIFSLVLVYMPVVARERAKKSPETRRRLSVPRLYGILYSLLAITLLCWALPKLLRIALPDQGCYRTDGQSTHYNGEDEEGLQLKQSTTQPRQPLLRERIQRAIVPFELTFTSEDDPDFHPRISHVSALPLFLWHVIGLSLLYYSRHRAKREQKRLQPQEP